MSILSVPAEKTAASRGEGGASATRSCDAPPQGASSPPPDAVMDAGGTRNGPTSSPAPRSSSPSTSTGSSAAAEPVMADDASPSSANAPEPQAAGEDSKETAKPKERGSTGLLPFKVLLTQDQALEIYRQRPTDAAGANKSTEVANEYGVSPKTIRDVWNRKTWVKVTRPLWCPQEVASYLQDSTRRSRQVLNGNNTTDSTEGDAQLASALSSPTPIRPRSSRESRAPTRMHATASPPPISRRASAQPPAKKRKPSLEAVSTTLGGTPGDAISPAASAGTPTKKGRGASTKPPLSRPSGGGQGRKGTGAYGGTGGGYPIHSGGGVGWDAVTSLTDTATGNVSAFPNHHGGYPVVGAMNGGDIGVGGPFRRLPADVMGVGSVGLEGGSNDMGGSGYDMTGAGVFDAPSGGFDDDGAMVGAGLDDDGGMGGDAFGVGGGLGVGELGVMNEWDGAFGIESVV